jgi:hypothetical protein
MKNLLDEARAKARREQAQVRQQTSGDRTRTSVSLGRGAVLSRAPLWEPYPVHVLPEPVRCFVDTASRAIGCDASYVALPLLAGLASAVGNTRTIRLKRGWTEPVAVWTCIIGESGTLKSPAAELPLRPILHRQAWALQEHRKTLVGYRRDLARYEADLAAWKRQGRKGGQEPPTPPERPVCPRFWTSDVTVEALADRLETAPRGLLVYREELSGWLGSFDMYRKGKSDVPHWLSMFGARPLIMDRKAADRPTIYVPRACVSLTGGVQPEVLARALGAEHFTDGLASRLLLAMPPRQPKRWSEVEVDPHIEERLGEVYDRLYSLHLPVNDETGEPEPVALALTPEAKRAWVRFYNQHAEEQAKLSGDLAAAWSKLEGYAARLALIVHCVRQVTVDDPPREPGRIDERSITAGVTLAHWHAQEARRVYAALGESSQARERRELLELLQTSGGTMTVRELARRRRTLYPTAEDAEQALLGLVRDGLARSEMVHPGAQGGAPHVVYRLLQCCDRTGTPANPGDSEVLSRGSAPGEGAEADGGSGSPPGRARAESNGSRDRTSANPGETGVPVLSHDEESQPEGAALPHHEPSPEEVREWRA